MREIKFRGFSEQQNKWIHGSYHKPFEDITQIIENVKNNASQMSLIKNGTEGQFTGLKDKNGVDIYEGDILEYKNDLYRHHLAKIFYKKGGLCFNIHEDDFYKNSEEIYFYESCADMQSKEWIVQFEIIGNIHEHPNLLK